MRVLLAILVAITIACGAAASAVIILAPAADSRGGYSDGQT
jgi:hypothetical protein